MGVTLGPFLTRKLFQVLGGREQHIEGHTLRGLDEGVVLYEGDLEPLYVFRPDALVYTTPRTELHRMGAPPPRARMDGPAIEMAASLGALGVVSAPEVPDATAFHALIALRPVIEVRSPEERDDEARLFAGVGLLKLADHIADEVRRNEGHPPRSLPRDLEENAAFVRAIAEYVVPDLPVAASFLDVATELDACAPRIAQSGEALRIAAELRAKSHLWRPRRSSN